jgi:hypothetical protein
VAAALAIGIDGGLTYANGKHLHLLREKPGVVIEDAPDSDENFATWFSALGRFLAQNQNLGPDELESRLRWWWRGENRALRRAMEGFHRTQCERGRGILVNRCTGEIIPARCKSWRECAYCAWIYGREVERRFKQVKGLRAYVVFTMPADLGDWSNKEHIAAQAKAMRRLSERLSRRYRRRFSMVWVREHNTKIGGSGRLHLNVIWDQEWVDQKSWLEPNALACGFGHTWIERIGARGRRALQSGPGRGQSVERYATKTLGYVSKDLSNQTDWPKHTRRHGASKAARVQMKRPERNTDWFFALHEPPTGFLPFDVARFKTEQSPECICLDVCRCGAPPGARVSLSYWERRSRSRASPRVYEELVEGQLAQIRPSPPPVPPPPPIQLRLFN